MLSKSKITFIRSLQLRKYRQKYHKIVVEGTKIVDDILREGLLPVETIVATQDWLRLHSNLESTDAMEIIPTDDRGLRQVSGFKNPNSVLAVCDVPVKRLMPILPALTAGLYLDGIRDPGNVGTIFRIADWFGIKSVFLSNDCADPYHPKVIQASMSSVFRVRWFETEIGELTQKRTFPVLCAVMGGEPMETVDWPAHGLLVLGNESAGIRDEVLDVATGHVAVSPRWTTGAESLNVAVAAGILCAQWRLHAP